MKLYSRISALLIGTIFALASTTTLAAVLNSKHDLSAGSTSGGNVFTPTGTPAGSDQVCVFCHTPHASNAAQAIPLWNRTTTSQTFTLYADTAGTLDGAVADSAIGGVSLACLSCHDGSIALASVLNDPGTGNTSFDGGAWVSGGSTLTGTNQAAVLNSASVVGMGTDLRTEHPVGIQYAGGGYTITTDTLGGTPNDTAFVAPTVSGTQAWVGAVGTGIPLFTNELVALNGTDEPFVECASCHNPHGTANEMFLRETTDNSGICVACHVK